MITAAQRGHKIEFIGGRWVYSDTKESIGKERPCIRCGEMPTKEGHDACLGGIGGISSACCGHGIKNNMIMRGTNECYKKTD